MRIVSRLRIASHLRTTSRLELVRHIDFERRALSRTLLRRAGLAPTAFSYRNIPRVHSYITTRRCMAICLSSRREQAPALRKTAHIDRFAHMPLHNNTAFVCVRRFTPKKRNAAIRVTRVAVTPKKRSATIRATSAAADDKKRNAAPHATSAIAAPLIKIAPPHTQFHPRRAVLTEILGVPRDAILICSARAEVLGLGVVWRGLSQMLLNLHLRQSFFYSLKKKACKKEKCLEKRQK